jgi:ribosome-associated protein
VTSIHIPREIQLVIDAAHEKKAVEVTVLELRKLTSLTDYFVLCNGESEPQIKTIQRSIQDRLKADGISAHHVEGASGSGWVLMDYDDFVVHIFSPQKRTYYELDRLWADAPRMKVTDKKPNAVTVP